MLSGKRHTGRRAGESGQVLLTGIIMMLILLLGILLIFDVHNVIRAKYKVETAHQAAALAGAEWQKESLNLIGEINLIKACETMLEPDDPWPEYLPEAGLDAEEQRERELLSRVGILTEMQTRISFLGPLVGFAAAQQAAKQNGLNPGGVSLDLYHPQSKPLQDYVDLLDENRRYLDVETVNNFKWREPYRNMVQSIVDQMVAVFPNARVAGNPIVEPAGLARNALYAEILQHRAEIKAADPPAQSSWLGEIYPFVKEKTDADYEGRWWNIDYAMADFPNESEIFTLGVEFSAGGYDDATYNLIQSTLPNHTVYRPGEMPSLRFCLYDNFWYPEYYRRNYSSYDDDHFSWWYEAGVLRKPVKPQYVYEGPAAYAEGSVVLDMVSRYDYDSSPSDGTRQMALDKRFRHNDWKSDDDGNNLFRRRIGARRTSTASGENTTDYRPGAIAKVLGELDGELPPITVPVILPVFDNTTLTPTYMPLPYGFGVLRTANSALDRFLNWLSTQESLFDYTDSPPIGTEIYLQALQYLTDGPGFRYYGWNPSWNADSFDRAYRARADQLFDNRSFVYSQSNPDGAGWLQEPQICTVYTSAERGIKEVTDYLNGGVANRFFRSPGSSEYIVVDSTGHIVTNDEQDPTVLYSVGGGTGGSGPGFGGSQNKPDTQPGPPRI
ncbi:pilus assembly protein TadG-related protein [uncultured Victivallis sp.]|uniref:pilus assembly protein TadG-related protein n=1 Tax=uncultured Victivallis sp. TaxID=354118 RepID=UPI0025FCED06|nr:pilus assembly protein TadG-related protein [uncultured Victivallis sp.]